jgi:hypothetical protein
VYRRVLTLSLLSLAACAVRANLRESDRAQSRRPAGPPLDIAYEVAFADPASHWYEVRLDIGEVRADTLVLQMPVWSPGRYARMDFAKNVRHR